MFVLMLVGCGCMHVWKGKLRKIFVYVNVNVRLNKGFSWHCQTHIYVRIFVVIASWLMFHTEIGSYK